MSDAKARPSKLKFKGEKYKKKRKRDHDDDGGAGPSSSKRREEADLDTWVLPEGANEIRGPTFIMHPSDPSALSINYNTTSGKVVLHSLDKDLAEDTDEPVKIMDRTPGDVAQVWVVTRIAGSPTINIRTGTGEGKFLSCDKYGLVSADRDARGPQEEWTPVVFPDGMVAFMNMYEKYLSVDEVAGGALQLRGDSEEVGFRERFWAKIQYKYKKEAHEEEKKRKDGASGPSAADETTANKLYQTWGAGRTVLSNDDKKELKRAKKDGRLAEALLDRRAKLKRNEDILQRTPSSEPSEHMEKFMEPPEIKQLRQIQNLAHFMTVTHHSASRFQRFLKNCRVTTKQMKLPRNKFSYEQEPALWKSYIDEICSMERFLSRYDNHWPIRVYFDLRVALYLEGKYICRGRSPEPGRSEALPIKNSSSRTSPLSIITPSPPKPQPSTLEPHPSPSKSHPAPSQPHPSPPKPHPQSKPQPPPPKPQTLKAPATTVPGGGVLLKRRLFVGKPPPDMRESVALRALTASPPPPPPPKPVPPQQITECDVTEDELTAAPCSNLPWKPKPKNAVRHPRIEVVHVRCYDCGRPLTREFAGPTSRMRSIIGDDEDQFNTLFEAGLVSDRQLEILLGWPPSRQQWFLERLSISAFSRQALKTKILSAVSLKNDPEEEHNLKVTWVKDVQFQNVPDIVGSCPSPKRKFLGVLQPMAEVEEKLTDPNEPIELLFAAMNLGDNQELFDDIVALVEKDSEPYIMTYRPSREQFDNVVKAIVKERIVFERYENEWPIRFIIKRIARKMGNKPADDHLTPVQFQKTTATDSQPKPRKGAPLSCLKSSPSLSVRISYTCPIHPGVDVSKVSQKIHQLLYSRGLAELLPVFASVGIREEAHLRQFCAFSDEEKDNVVDDSRQWERPIDLNIFQRIALKVEFTMQVIGQLI